MASLVGQQLKDAYQSLVTIGDSITSDPTSGALENGKGTPLTSFTIGDSHYIGSEPTFDNLLLQSSSGESINISSSNDIVLKTSAVNPSGTGTERMKITSGGDISFRDTSNNEAFYWDASAGSLGIGTDSPSANGLTIEKSGNHMFLRATTASAGKYWNFDVTSSNQLYIVNNDSSGYLTITDSGNVGIGTTSPGLSVFLDKVLTVGSTSSGQQGGLELLGNQSVDTVVSALTFNNQASGTADKRIAQIGASRDGDNNSGSLGFTVWNGVDSAISAMTIDSSGNLDMSAGGGNIILDSGAGIDFSDTANSSGTMTSELLDDYEEGTWTPVVRGSGTAGTYELSSSLAYYTKVGRLVTIHLSMTLDDPITGGGSGYTQITGLPYAKANSFHTTAVVNSIGFDYTGDYLVTRFTTGGATSTVLGIFGNVDDGSLSLTSISGLSAGDSFTITLSYLT